MRPVRHPGGRPKRAPCKEGCPRSRSTAGDRERRCEAILTRNTTAADAASEAKGVLAADRLDTSLIDLIRSSLDDDKAENVVVIDLSNKSSFADHMVIASGRSSRQVNAMAEHLVTRLKAAGEPSPPVEGLENCDWVLIDAGDAIVHLFRPEVREFYNLEKMWAAPLPTERPTARA